MHATLLLAAILLAFLNAGCAATLHRITVPETLVDEAHLSGMEGVRIWGDASEESLRQLVRAETPKMQALVQSRTRQGERPIINIAAVSGGADDGAFGAGLLVGWSDAGTRPDFDLVAGVSAGALIAPFVFLGRRKDAELQDVFTKYTQQDIFTKNVISGLVWCPALADSSPLARLIATVAEVHKAAEEVARALDRLYRESGIEISNDVSKGLLVSCDPRDLNEMLANIVDNACKHANSHVRVSCDGRPSDKSFSLYVEEDGKGLPPEAFEVVFEIGERWDSREAGSGLGLSIVRDLAELYGGNIKLQKSGMGGLGVVLTLPAAVQVDVARLT